MIILQTLKPQGRLRKYPRNNYERRQKLQMIQNFSFNVNPLLTFKLKDYQPRVCVCTCVCVCVCVYVYACMCKCVVCE